MWHFRKIDPDRFLFELTFDTHYVSFTGAGGKTTLIEYLASNAISRDKRVAITTTTKIWVKQPYALWSELRNSRVLPNFIRVGKTIHEGKLTGLDAGEIKELGSYYDLVLIEADGSKGKPLKYPAQHEPVIPSYSDQVIVVAGLDALWGTVDEQVFRSELFMRATGAAIEARLTPALYLRFFEDDAMMKGVAHGKCAVVLNKYDVCARHAVTDVAKGVLEKSGAARIIISSMRFETFYALEQFRE